MATKRCPRCGSIYPSWQPIHLVCFFARLSIFGAFLAGLAVLAVFTAIFRNKANTPGLSTTLPATVSHSSTASITITRLPTSTPKPTTTKAPPTRTSTLTAEPSADLGRAKIYTFGTNHVTIESPNAIEGDYRAVVDGMDYICVKIKDYPNRLYCYGNEMESGKKIQIKVYAVDGDAVVFEDMFWAP